ncbi:MAG: Mrp/NBP35 family ATP-binding protein, partial [Congregibacter sp.]|nr:Mrp/NBP35 family ATP-binding protein [Congregibacter sp.]
SGAVIVTTPQDIALLDARKGIEMFRKVSVPVLGVIENMATHTCSECGHTESIFGSDGGQRISQEYGLELLASLPLARNIREHTDAGTPVVLSEPDGVAARAYLGAAQALVRALEGQAPATDFPTISVSDD